MGGSGQGASLNFFGEALAAGREPGTEKVQDVPPPARSPRVAVAWLPSGVTVEQLAAAGLSPGVMSAGLGAVPAEQTYLDIGQGNRVFDSLYDRELPPRIQSRRQRWRGVVERAESAPAEIVPGLLASTLSPLGPAAFEARGASPGQLPTLVRGLRSDDLLIAIARPTGRSDDPLPIGIAGRGFDGNLTSDSTRLDGYVLSTDVAPTVLERLGVEVPAQMSGQPIRSEGSVDPAAIESLAERMGEIPSRRGSVIGLSLLLWLGVLAIAVAVTRGRAARYGVRLVGLAIVYMPLLLLLGAAIEPGEWAEALLVGFAAPLLGAATLALLKGYRALAVASALTVLGYGIDVIAGSPLTSLSLLGPNPGLGVRFYGIGNELEALLAVLVVAGTGAGLAGFAPRLARRDCAVAFLVVGLLCAFVFAAGRFGADVGAAIVLPVGSTVAAALVAGQGRRAVALAVAAPFAVLALLALIDLASGANAHLTRSVLDAGGLGDLADVAQRRLQLSTHSFTRPILLAFLPLVAALAVLAVVRRDRLEAWLRDRPAVRAGLLGALVATVVGTLANDSGALLLEIGTAYLLVFIGFAWAENGRKDIPTTKSYNSVRHKSHLAP